MKTAMVFLWLGGFLTGFGCARLMYPSHAEPDHAGMVPAVQGSGILWEEPERLRSYSTGSVDWSKTNVCFGVAECGMDTGLGWRSGATHSDTEQPGFSTTRGK